jgi:hypothetical protein
MDIIKEKQDKAVKKIKKYKPMLKEVPKESEESDSDSDATCEPPQKRQRQLVKSQPDHLANLCHICNSAFANHVHKFNHMKNYHGSGFKGSGRELKKQSVKKIRMAQVKNKPIFITLRETKPGQHCINKTVIGKVTDSRLNLNDHFYD